MRLVEFLQYTRGEIPQGTFVGIHFTEDSVKRLTKWMQDIGITDPVSPSDLHVTLLYDDKKGFTWGCKEYSPPLELNPDTYHLDSMGGVLVLRFENQEVNARHECGIAMHDVNWKFPSYKSHVSLSYTPSESPCDIPVPTFPLFLSHEFSTIAGVGPGTPTVGEPRG